MSNAEHAELVKRNARKLCELRGLCVVRRYRRAFRTGSTAAAIASVAYAAPAAEIH